MKIFMSNMREESAGDVESFPRALSVKTADEHIGTHCTRISHPRPRPHLHLSQRHDTQNFDLRCWFLNEFFSYQQQIDSLSFIILVVEFLLIFLIDVEVVVFYIVLVLRSKFSCCRFIN